MNIAILCYHRPGGSGVVAYEIGRAMAEEKGHMVHFMGLEPPFRLKPDVSENMKFHRVHVEDYPVFDYQPYALALASQLSDLIKRFHIDVIHSHYALPHAVSALLARDIANRPVKCVTTLHGTDITVVGAHPSMTEITCYAIEKSDVVTAVSRHLARETEKKLCSSVDRIETVYNFINPRLFNPSLRSEKCNQKDHKTVLIHVSNLRAVKRPLDVIHIFHGVQCALGDTVELHIAGEGPLLYEMEALVDRLGIEQNVRFLGVRSDIGAVIASSDLLLLPSREESFGLAALEAMSCGVPVAASRVGGLPEVIDDGRSGILFPVGDVGTAVEKILAVLKDRDHYRSIREEALKDAGDKFSMEKIVNRYEALYMGTGTPGTGPPEKSTPS